MSSWSYGYHWTYLKGLACLPASFSLSDFTDVSCTALAAADPPFPHVVLRRLAGGPSVGYRGRGTSGTVVHIYIHIHANDAAHMHINRYILESIHICCIHNYCYNYVMGQLLQATIPPIVINIHEDMTSPRFLIQGLYLGYWLQNWLRIWLESKVYI